MPQDRWPWTRITLPLVDSFLKGRSRMSHGQDPDQSGYYSEDSDLDSASITLVSVSEASTAREGQNREPEGTFDCCLNQKITLLKLNDDSSTNNLWIFQVFDECPGE